MIRDGKLRALAVTPAKRSAALPDVPSIGEFVSGYDAFGWYGLGAPSKTPAEIINKLSDAMSAALADPKSKARLADLGVEPMPLTSAGFAKFIADETDKWAKVIKSAGITLTPAAHPKPFSAIAKIPESHSQRGNHDSAFRDPVSASRSP